MKILTFTSLYPNPVQPRHGIFVENRIRRLYANDDLELMVVSPVPWFPFKNEIFGTYAKYASIPTKDIRYGIEILHPRYLNLPKVGMSLSPFTMAMSAKPLLRKIIQNGFDFDLIDAHYFYPDGVAASLLGTYFNKPVVITARGSDLSVIPDHYIPRKLILKSTEMASAMITVCEALKDVLLNLGVNDSKVTVLRNGVDLTQFHPPGNRDELRNKLGIDGITILSVGHLVERKGHHLVIKALQKLPGVNLVIIGDGPDENELKKLSKSMDLDHRVRFLGHISHTDMLNYYGAADVLVLASSREGWANVLLESLACGTPVVATNIWGTPEVITSPEAGILIDQRTEDGIAAGVMSLIEHYPDRGKVREYAEKYSWDDTTSGQINLFRQAIDGYKIIRNT